MIIEEAFDQVINEQVPANKGPWYEWATLKAYLMEQPKVEAVSAFQELFQSEPEELSKAPKWLITLACMWKGAELGHKRTKKRWDGLEASTLAALRKLDESLLIRGTKLHSHVRSGNTDILG